MVSSAKWKCGLSFQKAGKSFFLISHDVFFKSAIWCLTRRHEDVCEVNAEFQALGLSHGSVHRVWAWLPDLCPDSCQGRWQRSLSRGREADRIAKRLSPGGRTTRAMGLQSSSTSSVVPMDFACKTQTQR